MTRYRPQVDLRYTGQTKPMSCPNCGNTLDGFTGPAEKMVDGDVSVCAYCAELLEMVDGKLVRLTEKTLDEMIASPGDDFERLMLIARAARAVIQRRKAKENV